MRKRLLVAAAVVVGGIAVALPALAAGGDGDSPSVPGMTDPRPSRPGSIPVTPTAAVAPSPSSAVVTPDPTAIPVTPGPSSAVTPDVTPVAPSPSSVVVPPGAITVSPSPTSVPVTPGR